MGHQKKDLIRIDVNIEKMPVFFFGNKEKKQALEKQIFSSGAPYEILSIHDTEKNTAKKLSISPSAAYGLLTEFDQDVSVVVYQNVFDFYKNAGYCPREVRIPLSDFPKIMERNKDGRLYKNIKESAKRISEFTIYQENCITVKEKKGTLQIFKEKVLKLFFLKEVYKEEKTTKRGKKIRKFYLDIQIPDWIRNNIDNFYTTEFDIKKYFMIRGGRTRKLYRILELIRYEKTKFLPYEKLQKDLWIDEKEQYHLRQAIKRAITPLVKSGYLQNFGFNDTGILVTFSSLKNKRKQEHQLTLEEMAIAESLSTEMTEKLQDTSSKKFYMKVAKKVPEEIIYKCLSLTREIIETGQIKKSKGAVFTDILKKECQKLQIALS